MREDWQRITGVADLGADLPVMRPGCGSMSVDPDLVDELRARFGGDVLKAGASSSPTSRTRWRRCSTAAGPTACPVVPPTEERVLRMLAGHDAARPTRSSPSCRPTSSTCTVEKVAINAVMAGCRPEYLPLVLAASRRSCTDEFNIHGVLATTMPVGPVIICNGPGTGRSG